MTAGEGVIILRMSGEKWAAAILGTAALLSLAACGLRERNFSQYEGFETIRAARSSEIPSPSVRQLLQKFKPALFIAEGEEGPLDFYRDYVASGELRDDGGNVAAMNPTRMQLNELRGDPGASFRHFPNNKTPSPVGYGSARKTTLTLAGGKTMPVLFLIYHFAFRHSGLPAGTGKAASALADLAGDFRDWHQLDHYTAAFVALDEEHLPFAVLLQHHNHMRTYLTGEDEAFAAGSAPMLDAAVSSNELYPHRRGRTTWPAAGWLNARVADYLTGVTDKPPLLAAPDIADGKIEVDYRLEFLPPDDAFYVFEGFLGERRRLPGRDGPPGAIYNNVPALWPPEVALAAFYWRTPDSDYADLLRQPKSSGGAFAPDTMQTMRERFAQALEDACPKSGRRCG